MARKGRNILEKIEKYLKKVISIEIVALGRNCSHRHYGARSELWCVGVIYRLSILISADVSQPIQKIIGIDYLMSADTIKHIFGIGCTMSVDTNNVSGIRGVTPSMQNPNRGEILVCAVRLPKFPTLCAVASLDATPSPPSALTAPAVPPSSSPTPVAITDPIAPSLTPPLASMPPVVPPSSSPTPVVVPDLASLDAVPSTPPPSVPLPPSSTSRHRANPIANPAFGLDATGSAPIASIGMIYTPFY
jgi:hypothetical protein